MNSRQKLVFFAASLLALFTSAPAADVSGEWKAEFDTMIGLQIYIFEFKVDGEALAGTATGERNGDKAVVPLAEGRISGNTLSFIELLEFQGEKIRIAYRGTLTDDDTIKLTRQVGEVATEELVAHRVKE